MRFAGQPLDGLPAHERTRLGLARSFQLPRPFMSLSRGRQPARSAALHGATRGGTTAPAARARRALHRAAARWSASRQGATLPRDLTQVEMRKLELARAMAAEPKLLIADEAMAGLSHSEVDDIIALLIRLNEQGITIIMIEHIMRAVMSFSQRLVVLVSGRKIADGKPDAVMRDPEAGALVRGQAVEDFAGKAHAARLVTQRAAHAVHQRRLARAVGADQPDAFAVGRRVRSSSATKPPKRLPRSATSSRRHHFSPRGCPVPSRLIPFGATMTNPNSISPTISRLSADDIVTVATCCSVPSRIAPITGPSQLDVPPTSGIATRSPRRPG